MSAEVEGILRSFWEWRLRESPEFATQNGVHIYDDKLDCHSLEAYAKRQVLHSLVVNFTWWYEGWNVQTTVVSLLCVQTLHVPRPMDWTNRLLIEVVSIIFFKTIVLSLIDWNWWAYTLYDYRRFFFILFSYCLLILWKDRFYWCKSLRPLASINFHFCRQRRSETSVKATWDSKRYTHKMNINLNDNSEGCPQGDL